MLFLEGTYFYFSQAKESCKFLNMKNVKPPTKDINQDKIKNIPSPKSLNTLIMILQFYLFKN